MLLKILLFCPKSPILTFTPETCNSFEAIPSDECPSVSQLVECSPYMAPNELCVVHRILPDGKSDYDIDNCGDYDVFRCSTGK